MDDQKHTVGPLKIHPQSKTTVVGGKRVVAACGGYQSNLPGEDAHGENEANARRIVACWNICLGIPTEQLEAGAVSVSDATTKPDTAEVVESIRRLLPHCRPAHVTHQIGRLLAALPPTRGDSGLVQELVEALEDARSAFALFVEHFPSPETSHVDYRVRCAKVSGEAIRDIDAALAKRAAQAKAGA